MSRQHLEFKQPKMTTEAPTMLSNVSKWIPLLCAGAAVGIGIVALKEIKNIKKELKVLPNKDNNDEKYKSMELQILKISEYLKNNSKINAPIPIPQQPRSNIIKNAVNQSSQESKIINDSDYEEVEVTDDDEDN